MDVERRLRAVQYMESVLAKSYAGRDSVCSVELSLLLQVRKRPLEEMKERCVVLAKYGESNHLW